MNNDIVRKIGLIMIILLVFIIGWFTYDYVSKLGKVPTEIITVPEDASVSINDKPITKKTIFLSPGTYIVATSKEGFNPETQEVTILDQKNQRILTALTPDSQEAQAWARENEDQYFDFEGIAGDKATDAAAKNAGTIESVLPYSSHLFSIGTKSDESGGVNDFIVTVRAPNVYREAAIQQIKNLGYNPAEYKIEFIDYRNPFDV